MLTLGTWYLRRVFGVRCEVSVLVIHLYLGVYILGYSCVCYVWSHTRQDCPVASLLTGDLSPASATAVTPR